VPADTGIVRLFSYSTIHSDIRVLLGRVLLGAEPGRRGADRAAPGGDPAPR
jgi:hypothetical protein